MASIARYLQPRVERFDVVILEVQEVRAVGATSELDPEIFGLVLQNINTILFIVGLQNFFYPLEISNLVY